jgi:hypothetical protein
LICVEATCDELLGAYTRAEDDAMTLAFGGRGKKRLNRVFDVIGFVYPDYTYPLRKKGKKRKTATSAISIAPKGKKIKVLTHRPRYIETAMVPKLGEGTASTAEPGRSAPAGSKEELAESPKVPATESPEAPKHVAEAKGKAVDEPEREETTGLPKILSPPPEPELPKVSKAPAITPKRRRMASVLDVVMESTRASTPAPAKETVEATTLMLNPKLGPQCRLNQSLLGLGGVLNKDPRTSVLFRRKRTRLRRLNLLLPRHLLKDLNLLFDMLRVKGCLKRRLRKPNTTPGN